MMLVFHVCMLQESCCLVLHGTKTALGLENETMKSVVHALSMARSSGTKDPAQSQV